MSILQKSSIPKYSNKQKFKGNSVFPFYLVLLFALLVISFSLSLIFGSVKVSLPEFFRSLINGSTNSIDYRIIAFVRLPRAFGGLLAGGALAVAGVIIQAVLHNPMAAPNIIGVNSGAGLAAVILITLFPAMISFLPLAAFIGAVAACLIIYAFSSKSGADRVTITLVGIAVSSILNSAINLIKTVFPDSVYDADLFMIGGFSSVTMQRILPAGILIISGITVSLFVAKDIDVLSLGDETAKGLGMNVMAIKLLLLILASLLAGAAVSFAGLLGFVGLVVPHIARKLFGTNHRRLVISSALMGAILVLLCDLFGRIIVAPYEISVGIILSFIGGPFFILLILSERRRFYD